MYIVSGGYCCFGVENDEVTYFKNNWKSYAWDLDRVENLVII